MTTECPLKIGGLVKVLFRVNLPVDECTGERMWVILTEVGARDGTLVGELNNDPVVRTDLVCGEIVKFHMDDLLEIE